MLELKQGHLCPVCEEGFLENRTERISLKCGEKSIIIETAQVLVCPVCEESFFDRNTEEEIERGIKNLRHEISIKTHKDNYNLTSQYINIMESEIFVYLRSYHIINNNPYLYSVQQDRSHTSKMPNYSLLLNHSEQREYYANK